MKYSKNYFCKFCGSPGRLDINPDFDSATEAEETATEHCNCSEAREWSRRRANIEKLNQAVGEFTGYCKSHGLQIADEKVAKRTKLIFDVGIAVLDLVLDKCSFEFGSVKVAISTNSKNYLSLTFKYSDGKKFEI